MKHITLLVGMLLTCLLTAVANVVITGLTGFNLFSVKAWLVIPVGAGLVGFCSVSGALLVARYANIRPSWIDVVPMVLVAAATMVLIYFLDYKTEVLEDGRRVRDLVGFQQYVDILLTTSHLRMGRAAQI